MSTLYVDSQIGTSGGTGTAADPISTLTLAHTAATAGDTLRVRGGNGRLYREEVTFTKALTVVGYGDEEPEIVGSVARTGWTLDTGNLWYVAQATDPLSIYFVDADGVLTKGSRKTSAAACVAAFDFAWIDASDRLYVYATADPVTLYARVEMCSLDYGIHANGANGCVIRDVRLIGQKGVGLQATGVSSLTASDLYIGFQAADGAGGSNALAFALSDSIVESCGAARPATSAAFTGEGDGFSLHGTSSGTLTRVVFRDCLKAAINSIDTTTTVANRVRVERCNANVLGFHTTGTLTLRNSLIVMASNDLGGIGTFGTTVIENVGVYGAGTAAGDSDHNIGLTTFGTTTFRNLWITNCRVGWSHVLGTTTQGRAIIGGNGTNVSGTTLGGAVLTTAPTFLNAEDEDFRLVEDSSAVGEGVDLSASFVDDIAGRRRGTFWDIGPYAYEVEPREAVLSALCDALGTIGDPDEGDWQTDRAVVVHRDGLSRDAGRIVPFVEILRVSESYTLAGYSGTEAKYTRTMTVEFAYVSDGWRAGRSLGAVVADVEAALAVDYTLGGTCRDCFLASNESAADGQDAAAKFTVTIHYHTSDKAPTKRV